jgi:TolA-binding protein
MALAPSAAELFTSANNLRRSGEDARAIQSYRELQRKFPGSSEARQSYVTLGYLLLDSGQVAAALLQFDAYLIGGGAALQDALFGRARALQRLGRATEERRTLEQLVKQFPASVNAARAKARLADLQ